jgi:hypothetical protein
MLRQCTSPDLGVTARVEVLGSNTLEAEDVEFLARLAMALALSPRRDIGVVRRSIADAAQKLQREDL